MLRTHLQNCEKALLGAYKLASSAGHTLHKGDSREMFIKHFLSENLPRAVEIGNGEIIGAKSRPNESRNQYDIIIAQQEYPRISFGGCRYAYPIESVCATIEVKSLLTYKDLEAAMRAAINAKSISRNHVDDGVGFGKIREKHPHYMYCGLVAFSGPAKIKTVIKWIRKAEQKIGSASATLTLEQQRYGYVCPSLDGIVLLNSGLAHYKNPYAGLNPSKRNYRWAYGSSKHNDNLFPFYLQLLHSLPCSDRNIVNYSEYLNQSKVSYDDIGVL